jgi:hypothetical protein
MTGEGPHHITHSHVPDRMPSSISHCRRRNARRRRHVLSLKKMAVQRLREGNKAGGRGGGGGQCKSCALPTPYPRRVASSK